MGMFGGSAAPSLADIAAVTRNNDGNNGNNDGLGNGNGWWVLIILFALFGGWGNNGYGNNGGGRGNSGGGDTTVIMPPMMGGYGMGYGYGGNGFMDAAIQRGFDNQAVITKLDGLNSGICGLGYDQLAQMNGIANTVMQGNFGLQQAINQLGVSNMQDTFGIQQAINANTVADANNAAAISRQLSECCCDNRAALKDIAYNMATESCATNTNIHQTGDAIIQNQNQNFQMLNNTIRDGFTNLEMENQRRYIAELERKLNAADRDSALLAQSNYLVNKLQPCAQPAYLTCNPNTGQVWPQSCSQPSCGGCCG